jgi:hypothetical protein
MSAKEAEEVLEILLDKLEILKEDKIILALEIAINNLKAKDKFEEWLGTLEENDFDSKEQLLNTIKLKNLFCYIV